MDFFKGGRDCTRYSIALPLGLDADELMRATCMRHVGNGLVHDMGGFIELLRVSMAMDHALAAYEAAAFNSAAC